MPETGEAGRQETPQINLLKACLLDGHVLQPHPLLKNGLCIYGFILPEIRANAPRVLYGACLKKRATHS